MEGVPESLIRLLRVVVMEERGERENLVSHSSLFRALGFGLGAAGWLSWI